MKLTRTPLPLRSHPRLQRQRGVALLEVLGALAVGAVLLLGLSTVMDTSLEDTKGQQAAYYQSQVAAAAQKYMAANYATIQAATNGGALYAIGVPELLAGKFLATGTAAKNVYQQVPCVLIRQPDPAGAPGKFDALVVTSNGDKIPEKVLPMIAANAGASGGYISTSDSGNAKGGAWKAGTGNYRSATCTGGRTLDGNTDDGGHLASNLFFDGPGQVAADYLYRSAVPGRPELNRMNTPIRMANAALVAMGSSCLNAAGTAEAGLAMDAGTGGLLVCNPISQTWTSPSQWKEPVPNFGDLPASGNTAGDVRMVIGLSRAFTFNGAAWAPLAVDQNGNMAVPGTLTANYIEAGNVHTTQNIVADGTIRASGDISTSQNVNADLDVNAARAVNTKDAYVAHNVVTQGLEVDRWASTPAITVGIDFFSPGQACNLMEYDAWEGTTHITYPIGTIVTDSSRRPLICAPDMTMRYANGTYSP